VNSQKATKQITKLGLKQSVAAKQIMSKEQPKPKPKLVNSNVSAEIERIQRFVNSQKPAGPPGKPIIQKLPTAKQNATKDQPKPKPKPQLENMSETERIQKLEAAYKKKSMQKDVVIKTLRDELEESHIKALQYEIDADADVDKDVLIKSLQDELVTKCTSLFMSEIAVGDYQQMELEKGKLRESPNEKPPVIQKPKKNIASTKQETDAPSPRTVQLASATHQIVSLEEEIRKSEEAMVESAALRRAELAARKIERTELAAARFQNQELSSQNKALTSLNEGLTQQKDELMWRNKALEAMTKVHEAQLQTHKEHKESASLDVQGVNAQQEMADDEMEALQTRLEDSSRQVEALQEQVAVLAAASNAIDELSESDDLLPTDAKPSRGAGMCGLFILWNMLSCRSDSNSEC